MRAVGHGTSEQEGNKKESNKGGFVRTVRGRLALRADHSASDSVGNLGRKIFGRNLPVRRLGSNQIDRLEDVLRVAPSENV
jgi:hypothetical protein